jgi:hypothetical protein
MNATLFLRALGAAKVEYVLVGGLAVQLHGFQRSTLDIDLVLAMDDDNLSRFIGVAAQLGLRPVIPVPLESLRNASQIEQWHREKGMLAFPLREPNGGGAAVDVLVRSEVPFVDLASRATVATLFGHQVRIAAIDDLLTMKRSAGRPKDLLDIAALEKIKQGLDPNV